MSGLVQVLARPLGAAYAQAMRLRRAAFERGLRASHPPSAPCVAVGNISMGGSGKTPLTAWLLAWAASQGIAAVALTRGYGGRPPHLPYLVTPQSPWRECGDEPLLLARAAPEAHVVVDPKRKRSCPWAEARFKPRLLVLDDAMQHLAVRRHLNLVLLTPRDLGPGWNRVFPAGRWREGKTALARASAFLVKASANEFTALAPLMGQRLGAPDIPVFGFTLAPARLDHVSGPLPEHAESDTPLSQEPYILATAVADPQGVERSAREFLARPPEGVMTWRDHHPFGQADANAIQDAARGAGAAFALCTPKDAVKLADLAWDLPLHALAPEPRFHTGPSGQTFPQWWNEAYSRLNARLKENLHGAQETPPLP